MATHTANHRQARHYCASLDSLNPRDVVEEDVIDILCASPECTSHTNAAGGIPKNDQCRATAWCVVRWAESRRPKVILVENVYEFENWGPLDGNGKPIQSRKGEIFHAWVAALKAIGYRVEWRVLCSADYGAETTRRRLFVQAVRGRRKIVWPEPTHVEGGATDLLGERKPWRAAREIIDWSIKGRWLDEMPPKKKYGGLPLSPNTLARIMAGLAK